jgi:hypothetical protein
MRRSSGRHESSLEQWAVAWARARGIVVSKQTDPTGIMDHCFWVPGGQPWLIEFKDAGVNLLNDSEGIHLLQWYYLIAMRADGYRTAVVTTKEGFLRLMDVKDY